MLEVRINLTSSEDFYMDNTLAKKITVVSAYREGKS